MPEHTNASLVIQQSSILTELQVDINHQCYIIIHEFDWNKPTFKC